MSLREPTLFTLAALRDGPLHGYAIAASAKELSGGRISLTAGTLYGALDRLVGQGMIEIEREEVVDGRLRRYYRITESGSGAVDEELERLRSTVSALERKPPRATSRPAISPLARAAGEPRGLSTLGRLGSTGASA